MQWLINGLADGSLIAVLALAFMLVYSTTGIFYVALGAIYSLAPFVALALARAGLPWTVSLLAGAAAGALVSAAMEAANHWPLERRKSSPAAHIVTSLGLNIVIVQMLALVWGNELQTFGNTALAGARVLGLSLAQPQLVGVIVAAIVFSTVAPWMWRAHSASPLRALAANPDELALTGANIKRLRLLVFSLSGALASIVSIARAYDAGFDAVTGLSAVVLAFSALVIGGRGSVWGAAVGGLLLGVMRSAVTWFGESRLQEPVTFAVLTFFLLLWPTGLLGRRLRLEAEK